MKTYLLRKLLPGAVSAVFLAFSGIGSGQTNPPPASCTPAPAGLISWWRAEGDARDATGTNHGTMAWVFGFGPGKVGRAFVFSGLGPVIRVPDAPSLNPVQALTLEGWINISSFSSSSGMAVAGKEDPYADRQYLLALSQIQDQWFFRAGVGVPNGFKSVVGRTALAQNTWYHVAMTYNGLMLNLYLNGVLDGSAVVLGPLLRSPQPFYIGGSDGIASTWNFRGRIDELALYGRALSSREIKALWSAGSGGKCPAEPPMILAQPQSATVFAGQPASFQVEVAGSWPMSFQWRFEGTNLPGKTGLKLNLPAARYADAGDYSVAVSNAGGTVVSSNATLTVLAPGRPAARMLSPVLNPGRHFQVQFAEVPGTACLIQRAEQIGGPWVNLGTVMVDSSGIGVYEDADSDGTSAFYRLVYP